MNEPGDLTPTLQNERIVKLDIIRAIALFGILMVNMKFFSTPIIQLESTNESLFTSTIDQISTWFIFIFAEVKFISMFSMLFGIGFLLFMERGEKKGIEVKSIFRRRLVVLLFIGLIHLLFLWHGDILVIYAIVGFALLSKRMKEPQTHLKSAFIWIGVPTVLMFLLAGLMFLANQAMTEEVQTMPPNISVEEIIITYSEGTIGEIFIQRLEDISLVYVGNIFLAAVVFGLFSFGMYLWKTGIFTKTEEQLPRIRKIAKVSFIIGLLSLIVASLGKTFVDGGDSPWYFLQYGSLFIQGPAWSIFYVMSILLLLQKKGRFFKYSKYLQPVGQMALTNYLMQTIICTFIFYSYGLGLFGRVGPFYGILLTLGIYCLQIVWSNLWMKHFKFGPMEWLWRRLTYGKHAIVQMKEKPLKEAN
ncbi:DUF418 domain-containing protein [Evansella sp. AB-P1]|uniref:DUF418 domain-containing protein n=1 Tax=Evansella sp. AB-P1 TaxID=3037653 RepID=UPI00241E639A|nr:DUF418 domain-containing protein [Evansella sp. AB-P1]MDG5788588.1 DUF418 domain-containing protein [Evansella sp. AB-P1]